MTEYLPKAVRSTVAVGSRFSGLSKTLLRAAAIATVLVVLAPVMVILLSWGSDQGEIWQHLIDTQLATLLRNTLVLVAGVAVGVTVIGVGLAWLTVMCEFPGRRWLDWALMLPMAMPAYVLGFVTLGIFDFTGPVQQSMRAIFGESYSYVDIRNEAMVIVVLVSVLYPYVYMLTRSAFLAQGSDVVEAAKILGSSRWGAFFRVVLPLARPAIIAGVSLALMETLADFGTVSVFNYDTFTTAIYKSWFGLFSLQAAAQLASLLLLFVALALFAEKKSRGNRQFKQSSRKQHHYRVALSPLRAYAATAFCLLVLSFGFILPVAQLLQWLIVSGMEYVDSRYISLLSHTVTLGLVAAVLTVTLALLLAINRRASSNRLRAFYDLATLGYALPGTVLAVGVMLSFAFIDKQLMVPVATWLGLEKTPLLLGSVFALITAYWVRFLAVASGPIDSALQQIPPSIPEAAKALGASSFVLLTKITIPMLRPGILTAGVLVLIDVMKEMPATLLLRPFGWDTLAVRIYEMTSEGEWQRAALPALTLVLIGMLPVVLAIRQTSRAPVR